MSKNEVKRYDVIVVSKETRSFSVDAETAKKAVDLMGNIVAATDVIPIGNAKDCAVQVEIVAAGQEKTDCCKLNLLRTEKPLDTVMCNSVVTPEELFAMLTEQKNDGRKGAV